MGFNSAFKVLMEIGVALPGYKAARPCSWSLAPMEFQGQEWVELYATSTLPYAVKA